MRRSRRRHVVLTSGELYERAWVKATILGSPLGNDERAVLSVGVGAEGGYAVPSMLDPTVIPISNGSVNPFRAISKVVPTTVDDWKGVSSAGVTASYAAEKSEADESAPTLAQPAISAHKAHVFVPFTIEVGQDWRGIEAEVGALIADAKDDLEATKFALGSGTGEPQGLLVGATAIVTCGGTAAFAGSDLYSAELALPPRYRPRARITLNRFIAQKVRQWDTAGGASYWTDLAAPNPSRLIGYEVYEASAMASVLTTGSKILVIGDFSRYVIVERMGMSVELVPLLLGTNHRPVGERGLYAHWRNGAGVVDPNGFRVLVTG